MHYWIGTWLSTIQIEWGLHSLTSKNDKIIFFKAFAVDTLKQCCQPPTFFVCCEQLFKPFVRSFIISSFDGRWDAYKFILIFKLQISKNFLSGQYQNKMKLFINNKLWSSITNNKFSRDEICVPNFISPANCANRGRYLKQKHMCQNLHQCNSFSNVLNKL